MNVGAACEYCRDPTRAKCASLTTFCSASADLTVSQKIYKTISFPVKSCILLFIVRKSPHTTNLMQFCAKLLTFSWHPTSSISLFLAK